MIWGNLLFLTGADEKKREVYCYDIATGERLWSRSVGDDAGGLREPPVVFDENEYAYAVTTCATDGQHVFAMFATGDLVAFDFKGNEVWNDDLGPLDNSYGHAASLTTYGGVWRTTSTTSQSL